MEDLPPEVGAEARCPGAGHPWEESESHCGEEGSRKLAAAAGSASLQDDFLVKYKETSDFDPDHVGDNAVSITHESTVYEDKGILQCIKFVTSKSTLSHTSSAF